MRSDEAGAVEHRVATAEGAPERRAVQYVSANRVDFDVTQACEAALVPVCGSHGGAGGHKPGNVRADKPGGAGYTDRHNFRVGNLFVPSYTPEPTVTQCRFASPSS
jgi:hypothetical protein